VVQRHLQTNPALHGDHQVDIRAQPHHLLTSPGPRHLALLSRLCAEADATGDLIPDAVLGAIALENGCEVATLDRDFARFGSVRHRLLSVS